MKKLLFIAFIFCQVFVNAQAPTSGLVAYFPFNGNTTNNGSAPVSATLVSMGYTTNNIGTANSAIQFGNNLNSYVDFIDNGNLDFSGSSNFSVCFGFFFNGSSTSGMFDNCLNYGGFGVWLWSTVAGTWNIQFNYRNNSVGSAAATNFTVNQWHHVVAMRNNGTISIYIDGVFRLSATEGTMTPSYPINAQAGAMCYGAFSPPRYNPFGGKMDELRIYNRALSAAEITAVYNDYTTGGAQPVTITCPSNITVPNAAGQCGANVTYPAATATGTPTPTITYSKASGSFFNVGTTTVTATATNGTASSASCSFTVTVTGGVDTDNDAITDVCDPDDDNDGVADGSDCAPLDATKWQQSLLYIDNDNDGYTNGQATVCYGATVPTGYKATSLGNDCNDNNNAVWRSESLYIDNDGDGYTNGQATICYGATIPTGYKATSLGNDCNDNNAAVHPGATEICNDIDDDCDGLIDEGFINTVITCPFTGTLTKNLASGCIYTVNGNEFNATVTQNCGPLGYTLTGATTGSGTSLAGVQLNSGTTTVTWRATNANDQIFSCSFIVNVVPPFPTLTCPSNITVPATNGQCGTVVNYTAPNASQFCASQAAPGSQTFNYTGAYQTFIVPSGVTSITIEAWGAQGGSTIGGRLGGNGGYSTGNLSVTPGSTIYVYVGQQGQQTDAANLGYSSNSFNGGGKAWTWNNNYGRAGGGGGASDIRFGGNTLANRVLVAAGGGGATDNACTGGVGGGLVGGNGGCNGSTGGTQTAGGTGGVNGTLGAGGDANSVTTVGWTGGGGGGYYGGGCGNSHWAGAGGSSYIGGVTGGSTTSGLQTGNGKVIISWQGAAQPSVDQLTGLASGATFPVGTTTNTFMVTDAFGQTNTCSFTVTVNDEQAPTVVQPNNITVSNATDQCSASVNFSANATDNCSVTSLKYYLNHNTANQEEISFPKTFAVGNYVVTVVAKDAANNTTTKQFPITVNDTQKPNVTAGTIGSCYSTIAAAQAAALDATTYSDNCSSFEELDVNVSTEGSCSAVITITVTDASNNSKSVTYNTKIDNTAPVLSLTPANVTVNCQSVPAVPTVTASDNCDGTVNVIFTPSSTQGSDPAQSSYYNYSITRKWFAADACGNTVEHIQTITVQDITAPTLSCPANKVVSNDPGSCSAQVSFNATSSDLCSTPTIKYYLYYGTSEQEEISSPHTFAVGSYTVKVVSTDPSSNANDCTFTVIVNDTEKPAVTKGSIESCYKTVVEAEAAALAATTYGDNCTSNPQLDVAVTTVGSCRAEITVTVADAANNSRSVTYNTRIDNTAPVLSLTPANATVNCQSVPSVPAVTATDNCDEAVNVTFTPASTQGSDPSQSNYYNYIITRKWFATDGCGNTVEHIQTITVQDITAPILTCPGNKVVSNDPGSCSAQVSFNASSSDNCSTPTVKYYLYYGTSEQEEISSPHIFTVGTHTVKVVSTDPGGNSNDCTFTVTVNDTEKPTITKGSINSCYKTVTDAQAAALAATTYGDNCTPNAQLNVNVGTLGNCNAVITVTVTDAANNSHFVTYNTRIDDTAPVLSATLPSTTVNCHQVPPVPTITASDNCDGAVNVIFTPTSTQGSDPSQSNYYNYTITRKWSASDGCGNTVEHIQIITVKDITQPALTCPGNIVVSNETGLCSAQVSFSATSSDLCSTPTVKYYLYYGAAEQQEITSPWIFAVGSYIVKVISTDPSGNSSNCSFTITVNDTEKPTVTKGSIGGCYKTVAAAQAAALAVTIYGDNCTPNAQLNVNVGTVGDCSAVITVTVADAANNSHFVTYNTRIDNTAPVLNLTPASLTVNCQSVPPVPTVTANDNCDGNVNVTFIASNTQGNDPAQSNYYNYTITRKWSASDGCGNTVEHIQIITVQDITGPVITCPSDKLNVPFDFDQLYATIAIGNATATDNCAGTGNIRIAGTRSDNVAITNQQYSSGTTTVSWSATDPSNNSSGCTQTITVRKRGTTVTYTGPMSNNRIGVQYSDIINLQAELTDNEGLATPNYISGRTIKFQLLNGTTVLRSKTATTDANGIAIDTFKVEQVPGSYIIKAIFAGDSYFTACSDQDNCEINQEDAIVEYNGSQYFTTASPTSYNGTVTFAAAVNDIDDGSDKRGDIRKAKATFKDGGPSGTALGSANLPVGLITPGVLTNGLSATSQSFTLNTNDVNNGGRIFQVWVGASDHYTGADAGPTPVTLALPGQDFVTGGGHLVLANSAGTYSGTVNSKMNFGFTMKWNKSGKNLQGQINIVFRKWQLYNGVWQWRVYQMKSNAINSMAVVEVGSNGQPASGTNPAVFRKAIINTKANLKDVTDPLNNLDLGGNHSLVLDAWDHITANGGISDKIAVTLMAASTNDLLFSSSWVSNATQAQIITGGNINVRGGTAGGTTTKSTTTKSVEMESQAIKENVFEVKVYPNPTEHQFALIVKSNSTEKIEIQIYDAIGRKIETLNVNVNETSRFGEKLKTGIYFAKVIQGNTQETVRLIKQ